MYLKEYRLEGSWGHGSSFYEAAKIIRAIKELASCKNVIRVLKFETKDIFAVDSEITRSLVVQILTALEFAGALRSRKRGLSKLPRWYFITHKQIERLEQRTLQVLKKNNMLN